MKRGKGFKDTDSVKQLNPTERLIEAANEPPAHDAYNTSYAHKTYDTINTHNMYDALDTSYTPNKGGRPKHPGEFYRINLKVPKELEDPIREARHRQRKNTITQYIVDLIRADIEKGD